MKRVIKHLLSIALPIALGVAVIFTIGCFHQPRDTASANYHSANIQQP
ncbi:hypothetical protein EDC56_0469 [Sinobacterium caligoides]|uniref:Lipoprotein n=1 Tax=Sinobacterium caligoides TaxID=933926 RepID=A0A3N2DZ77_9GAMM|nr:hypothetical protein EDC56_0469 [Sinobacterium caligoides]